MYKKIINNILAARRSGKREDLKIALQFLAQEMLDSLDENMGLRTYALFINDKSMLFPTNTKTSLENEPDKQIISTGLLDQTIEMMGIAEHEQLSKNIADSAFTLYSIISSNSGNINKAKNELRNALRKLLEAVE